MRRHLSRAWWLSIILLLLLAILLTATRLLLQNIDHFRPDIQRYLARQLGVELHLGRLSGRWSQAYPVLEIADVQLRASVEAGAEGYLALEHVLLEFDPFGSLLAGVPVFQRFEITGVTGRLQQRDGAWLQRQNTPPPPYQAPRTGTSAHAWQQVLALLLSQPYALIKDAEFVLIPEQGSPLVVSPADFELENTLHEHRLSGVVRMPQLGDETELDLVLETTDRLDQDPLSARYRAYLDVRSLGPRLAQVLYPQLGIRTMQLDTRLWLDISRRRLERAQAQVDLSGFSMEQPWPVPDSLSAQLSMQPAGGRRYQLQVNRLRVANGDAMLVLPQLVAGIAWPLSASDELELGVAALDLGELVNWYTAAAPEGDAVASILRELDPGGEIKNLRIDKRADEAWRDLVAVADIEAVGVSAWHGAPGLKGVTGRLEAGLAGGQIDLVSTDFAMQFPDLFPDEWHYQQASGRVRWILDSRTVRVSSERLQLKDEQVRAAGRFSIDLPLDHERQSELVLMIGMTDSDGRQAPGYTPEREVGSGLHRWLRSAIRSGHLRQGGLLLRTGTRRLPEPRAPVVQLFLDIADGSLDYQAGWPEIRAADLFVLVRDAGLVINIAKGQLLNTRIETGWAYLAPAGRELQIEAQLNGPIEDVDHVLKQTPLAELLGNSIQRWQLSGGQASTRLGLRIPLHQQAAPGVSVSSRLKQVRLASGDAGIEIDDVQGRIRFDTGTGLRADKLSGIFLQQPVTAQIEPTAVGHSVHLLGSAGTGALAEWLQWPVLSLASGELDWQGELGFCADPTCNRLTLESTLTGVELALPGRLVKRAEQAAPLSVELALSPDTRLARAEIQLPVAGSEQALNVLARPGEANRIGIRLGHPLVAGQVILPSGQSEQPLELELDHLSLELFRPAAASGLDDVRQPVVANAEPASVQEEAAGRFDISAVPAMDIHVGQLNWADKPLGDWRFQLRPVEAGLRIAGLEARLEQLMLRGEAHWHRQPDGLTALTLKIAADDVGVLFERWGYAKVMETSDVKGTLQLQWPGAPWAFDLRQLAGEFSFATGQGRLIESADSSNFLRVFGILNFNSLGRRLRLDFSDLLQKGVSYDRILGDYVIEQGVARTRRPLSIEGPSANMQLEGQVDIAAEQLDLAVEVALPLTSNAPFAAVLLGAPQVAGAAFVIDKLIGDKLQRFSTLKYTLKGHWDEPDMQLQSPQDELRTPPVPVP